MNKRIANKILNADNYYYAFINEETGDTCFVPKTPKLIHLFYKACLTVKNLDIYNQMCQDIEKVFGPDDAVEQ